jgi:hypothetical protein
VKEQTRFYGGLCSRLCSRLLLVPPTDVGGRLLQLLNRAASPSCWYEEAARLGKTALPCFAPCISIPGATDLHAQCSPRGLEH